LANKETNGKCDPYCLLELINMRAQTHTARKTFNPTWQKVFVFPVTDIHSVLYITVKDDEKSKCEFLGRVAIPLMKVRNHERSWYALKNADLTERSRGSLLLEFFFVYNHFKAAWRTLNPAEAWLKHPVRPQKYKKLSADYKNPYMVPLGMIVGILASRKTSKNPYLLDVVSSAKVAAGVGASTLGPVVNHEKYIGLQSSQQSEEDPTLASPKVSFEYDSDVFINNELLHSLKQEVGL
uniref:C2 domain-containing protein n=1 Tax=Hydatigena taeniaeformis TaxID=6205 RepID=A0A0R3XCW1_HYDTA